MLVERCDVAVLGAGLAGLCAARDLTLAGLDVIVLEARERSEGALTPCLLRPLVATLIWARSGLRRLTTWR